MAKAENSKLSLRGVPLVEHVIELLRPHVNVVGGDAGQLNHLEDELQVELPLTLRTYLAFDFAFDGFGRRWHGRGRFGRPPARRRCLSSLRTLAEAMTEFGFTQVGLRGRLVRLPNLPGQPWNALYLGEARSDGELPILGLITEASALLACVRYTGFDRYLLDQSGLSELKEGMRLEDLDSHLVLNPELSLLNPEEDFDSNF